MLDLQFEQPDWIHALWGVVLLGFLSTGLLIRRRKLGSVFVAPRMQQRLARAVPFTSRLVALLLGLVALGCFVLALMRPQYGFREKSVPFVGAQVMICLDVSKSMLAEDATPNRLERAKSELEVLLNYLQGDQVGLIAFAGKASVVCPLTTDLGFLKMVLRETSGSSVGRGGTSLEAPLRLALSGFAEKDGMSKVILLITDGEDNGSKPLDAAREAAERGVNVIAVGFGHERGSKIEITDPRTGLRSYVTDSGGNEVVSRLDLDMLKSIAAATNGVVIPARVGSLDAESIHREHIRPLMRSTGETRLVVRNEAFQWPLMAGFMMTLLSLFVANPHAFSRTRFRDWLLSRPSVGLIPFVLVTLTLTDSLSAQNPPAPRKTADPVAAESTDDNLDEQKKSIELGGEFSSRTLEDLVPEDPLECYNRSVDVLRSNPEFAEKLLEAARRQAGDNAALRYRSSYNLGWANVYRADENLENKPEEALRFLSSAADWFREAVRLRPQSDLARQNLEIILKRIAGLNDQLQQKNPLRFEQQLDELIQRQTKLVETSRRLLKLETDRTDSEERRKSFRLASVDQRLLNSDLQEVVLRASRQLEEAGKNQAAGGAGVAAEPDPQEQLKLAQISQALVYADRASQRLGQARSQLRLFNAGRASLRGSLGLDELKRARDQLRDPAEILRLIMADCQLLRQQTLALIGGETTLGAFLGQQPEVPAWLDRQYLEQAQNTQWERATELAELILSIPKDADTTDLTPGQKSQTETIRKAAEYVGEGARRLENASKQIQAGKLNGAESEQLAALVALKEAYELFADLKGLLELTYQDHVELKNRFPAAKNLSGDVLSQVVESFGESVRRNAGRAERIRQLVAIRLEEALEKQSQGQAGNAGPANGTQDPAANSPELEKLRLAGKLVDSVQTAFEELESAVNGLSSSTPGQAPWDEVLQQGDLLEHQLQELRRLFFTIVEHLKETRLRQSQVNDDTERELMKLDLDDPPSQEGQGVAGPEDDPAPADPSGNQTDETVESLEAAWSRLGPLGSRQSELASTAGQIAAGLKEMSESTGQQLQPGSADVQQAQQMMQKYAQAAELVEQGREEMAGVVDVLGGRSPAPGPLRKGQREALDKLTEALQLLDDSQSDDQNSRPDSSQQDQEEDDVSNQALLQRIRDLEAQRRRNRSRTPVPQQVDKDW